MPHPPDPIERERIGRDQEVGRGIITGGIKWVDGNSRSTNLKTNQSEPITHLSSISPRSSGIYWQAALGVVVLVSEDLDPELILILIPESIILSF